MDFQSVPQKRCAKCSTEYPATIENFRAYPTGTLVSTCRECERDAARKYYYNNRQHVLEERKKDRENRPEIYAERDRLRYQNNPEKERARWAKYREENREKVLESTRSWRRNNPDKIKAYSKYYYDANRENQIAKSRNIYRQKHNHYIILGKKAGAKKRSAMVQAEGSFTAADILELREMQCDLCAYCGIRLHGEYHIDHIIPLSRGGSNWPDNLALTCAYCNLSKRNKLLSEWVCR